MGHGNRPYQGIEIKIFKQSIFFAFHTMGGSVTGHMHDVTCHLVTDRPSGFQSFHEGNKKSKSEFLLQNKIAICM